MHNSIAITAINAGDAFEHCKGPAQTTKVGELRDRIAQVLDMLDAISISDPHTFPPPAPIPTVLQGPSKPQSKVNTATLLEPSVDANHLTVSDQSRKRCASDLEEHRTVKALKREPQEDAPIALSIQEAVISPQPVLPFTTSGNPYAVVQPTVPVVGSSRPPSRPPTPPFVANNSFGIVKTQPSVTAAFPAFLPVAPPPGTLPINSAVPPPAFPHSSWSDPVVPTRHHHSLSAGSISGPVPGLNTSNSNVLGPFSSNGIPGALSQPLTNPSTSGAAALGRMSRSGSISGTNFFRNTYAPYPYSETIGEQATPMWNVTKPPSSTIRGSYPSRVLGDPGGPPKRHAMFTMSGGHSSHNSPSDDEDDDDDSDSDASSSGKTVTYHVGFTLLEIYIKNHQNTDIDHLDSRRSTTHVSHLGVALRPSFRGGQNLFQLLEQAVLQSYVHFFCIMFSPSQPGIETHRVFFSYF